ncbi:MAG: hypothetical protein PHI18_05610 [bacterium]|nr:hypothetical protein [bacterium]
MNRWIIILVLIAALFLVGCQGDDDEPQARPWTLTRIWPHGSKPIPAPIGDRVLFLQEESPAGLYLLHDGTAVQVNPTGPVARSDYAWSSDGLRFAFSSPGVPGTGDAGIYVASVSSPTSHQKIWDRGSDPCFLMGNEGLLYAGPEDGSDSEGLWQYSFSSESRLRLAPQGVAPSLAPDGLKIAYLIPGDRFGRIIVVLDRQSAARDTLPGTVLRYAWLGDSQTIIQEQGVEGVQELYSISFPAAFAPTLIAPGTFPAGLAGQDFVFAGFVGDQIAGLFTASPQTAPVQITAIGTLPAPSGPDRILAQDSLGLFELTR